MMELELAPEIPVTKVVRTPEAEAPETATLETATLVEVRPMATTVLATVRIHHRQAIRR
jgi:hypothetical protein